MNGATFHLEGCAFVLGLGRRFDRIVAISVPKAEKQVFRLVVVVRRGNLRSDGKSIFPQ
jgi:hypothetical protein